MVVGWKLLLRSIKEGTISTLRKFQAYMVGRRFYLPASLFLSGLSTLLGMMPFIFIWLLVKALLNTSGEDSYRLVSLYGWWALGTAVAGVAVYFLALTVSHLAAFRVETEMRRQAMAKILKLPLGFFDKNTTGGIRKIIDDNASITHTFLAHQMPDMAGSVLMPLISIGMIFYFDWRFGLVSFVPVLVCMALMSFMMGKSGHHFMKLYMNSLEEMNTEAVEYVRGIPVVKVFQQTVFSFKNFHKSIMKYKDMVLRFTLLWEKPMSAYSVIIHSFVYILVPLTIILTGDRENPMEIILNLVFYILITPVFGQSIMKNMNMNHAFGQAKEAVNRVENLTNVEPLKESLDPEPIVGSDIEFKNVSFTYPGNEQKAVDNLNFKLPKGKTFALVGPSGGGKTTIARLIPRFWDVGEGAITIGGTDIRDTSSKDLMENVSFVFQNTRLFKTTIRENIKLGRPNASDEEIEKAVDMAQCREILDKLPDGLDTMIGTEGTWLSGGEQQRVALARAFLKDAPVVVLDEATAFADPENEHLIQKAIKKLMVGKTVLMIAHRLMSVVDVDSIMVIGEGKIVEQGTHDELLGSCGLYSNMWSEYQKSIKWTIGREV